MARNVSDMWWQKATWPKVALVLVSVALIYVGSLFLCSPDRHEPGPYAKPWRERRQHAHLAWIERHFLPGADSWPPEYRKSVESRVGWYMTITGIVGVVVMRTLWPRRRRGEFWGG